VPVDIATLRRAYLCGQTSPTEQVERFLVQRQDPDWAVVWIALVSADRLRQRAWQLEEQRRTHAPLLESLPLYGILFAVKDNIDVAGMPTTAGCPAFAYRPEHSAPVVQRLEAAGAILAGKTNLDQFATGSLAGVVAFPLMLGGAWLHSLAPEVFLRPVLVELGATCPVRGLYLLDSDYHDPPGLDGWVQEARRFLA